VLAGGLSRRFGGVPKGLERVGGIRIIDRVANALRTVTPKIVISSNDGKALKWLDNVVVMADKRPRFGGLAGIESVLEAHGDSLVVAWDMPFVTPALLELLTREQARDGADIVVPESESPYGLEPFCAFYSARALRKLTAFLDAGGGAARDFIRSIDRVRRVPLSALGVVGDPGRLLFSVNTPDDLARANAMVETP
jgi:molybdopterin-guanine dinucleotide biosynthesis protein A